MPTGPSRSRRELLAAAAALGIGGATFHRAVAAVALQQPKGMAITAEMVKNAEWVAGVTLTDEQRTTVAARLTGTQTQVAAVRKLDVGYDVPPSLHPTPGRPRKSRQTSRPLSPHSSPSDLTYADLAFSPSQYNAHFDRISRTRSRDRRNRPRSSVPSPHRGNRPEAGRPGGQRAFRGQAPRRPSRHPLGRQGPHGLSRLQDHLGRGALQGAVD